VRIGDAGSATQRVVAVAVDAANQIGLVGYITGDADVVGTAVVADGAGVLVAQLDGDDGITSRRATTAALSARSPRTPSSGPTARCS
jgi:hypothetical protein